MSIPRAAYSGRRARGTPPPSALPPHADRIMEAFLLGNKGSARAHERRHQRELQASILSRLRRPAARAQEPSARRPVDSDDFWNARGSAHVEVRPLVRTPTDANDEYWNALAQGSAHEAVNGNSRDGDDCENVNNGADVESRKHHRNLDKQAQPSRFHHMNVSAEDDENDIVCCEGGHYREGTKNLCTIALWATIVFFIVNRFFVHMAMHLGRGGAETRHKRADFQEGGAVQLEIYPVLTNATAAEVPEIEDETP
ncbi:hypothetical protein ACHAWF_015938 [Thalassiosira exigua]